MSQVDQRILLDDDETMSYGHDFHIPLIEDEFSGDSSGDDESVVSDHESVVTGNRVESIKTVKKSVNGLVKLGEEDKLHGIIVNKFVAKLGEIGVKADVECVYRNMFGLSLVSQAKVRSFQIYAKAVGAKNAREAKVKCGWEAKVKCGWFGGCSKQEIDKIVGFGFGYGDVGTCEGFGNAEITQYRHSYLQRKITRLDMIRGIKGIAGDRILLMVIKDFIEKRILLDDDETMSYGHDFHIPLIEDEFSGDSSGDDESVVSDHESVVTGNRVESIKTVKKSVNGLVKLGEDDKLHGIIVNKFVSQLGEIGVKADVECVYRNMFGLSLVSQAKVRSFQIYAKAVGAKNGREAKVKCGWFGGCSKQEIDRIVGFGFGYGDVGTCEGFRNAVVLNAYHLPFEIVESVIVDDDWVKHILLCRVLFGKTEVVNRFSTQCHLSSEEFDSAVDNAVTPKKYIIWSSQMNTHIFSEFIISFKTQRIANRPQVNGVRLEKPVSPWIPIPYLIAKLSKMLPPKSIKEITQYRHSYLQRKITRLDMIRGIKGIAGDRILLMVIKDFTEKVLVV
nr:probable inactive poly [ADP-ribose] polymerase SRO5 [Tanacetum cinerariifolium]